MVETDEHELILKYIIELIKEHELSYIKNDNDEKDDYEVQYELTELIELNEAYVLLN